MMGAPWAIAGHFDRDIAILGVLGSIVMIIYFLMTMTRPIYLLPMLFVLIACMAWLLRGREMTLSHSQTREGRCAIILPALFFVMLTFSIVTLYLRPLQYERPLIYLLSIAVMAGVLGTQVILSTGRRTALIMVQIIIVGISAAWSQMSIFPHSVVGIDPWYHQMIVEHMLSTSHLPQGDYSSIPIYHLLIHSTANTLGLDYQQATMLSVTLTHTIIGTLLIFLLGKFVLRDVRVGLAAALVLNIANHHLSMGFWTIPTTLAAVFMIITLYLLLKTRQDAPITGLSLSIIMMVAIILSHTVTAACLTIVLFVGIIAFYMYRGRRTMSIGRISLPLTMAFLMATLAWWAYGSPYLIVLRDIVASGFSMDFFTPGLQSAVLDYSRSLPFMQMVFADLAMFVYFAIAIFGVLYMVSKRANQMSFALALMGFAPLAIGFSFLISGRSIIEHRWWYYAQILLSIPAGMALVLMADGSSRMRYVRAVIPSSMLMILCFISIVSPIANVDNQVLTPGLEIRYAVTDSELVTAGFTRTTWPGTIATDSYFSESVLRSLHYPVTPLDDSLFNADFKDNVAHYVLIRKEIMEEPFSLWDQPYRLTYDPRSLLDNTDFSKVYCSRSAAGYVHAL